MNEWIGKLLIASSINGGKQFTVKGNAWTLEEVNAFIEGILYADTHADEAKALAELAKTLADNAVQSGAESNAKADSAVITANESKEQSQQAKDNSTQAVTTANQAKTTANVSLEKVEGITAESVEDGNEMYAEVITQADGSLKLVIHNAKGEKGDGVIPIYTELGNNIDGAINQKVVTEELLKKLEANDVLPLVSTKSDKTYVDAELLKKANITELPTNVSDLANDSQFDTVPSVNSKIATAGGAIISNTTPTGKANAIWINPTTGVVKYWNGSAWASTYGVFS